MRRVGSPAPDLWIKRRTEMLKATELFRILAAVLCVAALPLLGAPAARASALPAVGLVSWWPGDGDALDAAGSNSGTPYGGVTYAPGMVGQAFSFNGQKAGIGVPDAD